jgi:hypothetical protein
MKSARAAAGILWAALLLAAHAAGQDPSAGGMMGRALDSHGDPVVGVIVTVTGPGLLRTAKSDAGGEFVFMNLAPGQYSVRLERTGFEPVCRDVILVPGRSMMLSIIMAVARVAETVTVGGEALARNAPGMENGASIGRRELEGIPTTRDPWTVLRQLPGVLLDRMNVGGGRFHQESDFVSKGSRPDQNIYRLDGVPISLGGETPFLFDFDSLDEFRVSIGGPDPALATPGATVDLVTRRGTNRLLGSARALYTEHAQWEYGIEAGGPLWKDRLWLWGAYARNDYLGETLFNHAGESVRSQNLFEHWNGRLDAQLLPENSLTIFSTRFEGTSQGWHFDANRSRPSSWNNLHPGRAYRVQDSHVLSPKVSGSISFAYVSADSTSTPAGGLEEQADLDANFIWRHSFQSRRISDAQHQAALDGTAVFETGSVSHELKFGTGYRHVRFDSAASWPGDALVGDLPFGEAAVTRPQNSKSEVNLYDVFAGDTISTGRFACSVGARFDYQQGRNLPSAAPANPAFPWLLPALRYGGDAGYPITWRLFQPRIGASYAPGDGRTLLRASYSRFGGQMSSTTVFPINASPGVAELDYAWNDANGNGRVDPAEVDTTASGFLRAVGVDPNNPGSVTPVNRISKNLAPPTTDEFVVGVERRILADVSASLAYTYRVSRNLEFSPLIGTSRASYNFLGNVTGTAVSSAGFVLNFREPFYGLTQCPDPCAGTVLENRPDARETYRGVEFQLLKTYSHGWMARVGFAYNDWRQHIGSAGIIDPNNETPGSNANGPVVAGGINATWQFNVGGILQLPLGITAGMNFFGRQGFPILYSVNVLTGDSNSSMPAIQIGRATSHRTADVYELDVQLSREFRIGSRVTVSPRLVCFNLLDRRTVLQRDGFVGVYHAATKTLDYVPPGQFNSVVETLSSRAFRGGVTIAF